MSDGFVVRHSRPFEWPGFACCSSSNGLQSRKGFSLTIAHIAKPTCRLLWVCCSNFALGNSLDVPKCFAAICLDRSAYLIPRLFIILMSSRRPLTRNFTLHFVKILASKTCVSFRYLKTPVA